MKGKALLVAATFSGLVACVHASKPNAVVDTSHTPRMPAFVSKKASEAILKFSHRVELISNKQPDPEAQQEQIDKQIEHLFGPMERAEYSAVPKEDQVTKITAVKKKDGEKNVYEVFYDYTGTIVVTSGPSKHYDVLLPVNPDTIYKAAMGGARENPCTDEHYNSEGDFWYFWSPAPTYKKCHLKEGVDYDVVHADITRIKKDGRSTYPEYPRLADKEGMIDVHVFFGLDDPDHSHNANRSGDESAKTYRSMRLALSDMGFTVRPWSESEIKAIWKPKRRSGQLPTVDEATKEIPSQHLTIRVRLFYGETGVDEHSQAFHYFFRDALQNSAIMIYDGHSGLGGHLDLASIAENEKFDITPNKDRYQIYFFNSCTSYTYYNALYFQRKRGTANDRYAKGTKNLDILANGLSTEFDDTASNDLALIRAIDNWGSGRWTSYQGMARKIDSENLFTVNGDEDNPPPKD